MSNSTRAVQTAPDEILGLSPRKFWVTAGVLALAGAIAEIQNLMVIPLFGELAGALNVSASMASWTLTATLLAGAVAVGPLARLSDRVGPKKVYTWSMIAVLFGNLLCAVAISISSAPVMIAGRVLIGLNIGTMMGVAILRLVCTRRQMAQGMGLVTLGLGIGVAPAFLIAGVLIDAGFSLSGVFWFATGMSVVVVALIFPIPNTPGGAHVRIPIRSSLMLGAWALPACLALSFGNVWGWVSAPILGLFAFSAVTLVMWLHNEQRARTPLIATYMLRGNALIAYFCTGCVGVLAYGYYITATSFVSTPSEIAGYGFGATITQAGLVLVPAAVVILILGPTAGRLIHTWGAKNVLLTGGVVLTAQFACMALVKSELWQMYVYAGWFGVGVAFFMPAGWAIFALHAKPQDIGIAGGMSQISALILGAFAASMGIVFTTRNFVPGTTISVEAGYTHMFIFMACVLGLATLLGLRLKPDHHGDHTADAEMTATNLVEESAI